MISSRTLLLFLIALNLLALAWWSGAMEPLIGSVREPGRLESQIEPNSLELVLTPESGDADSSDATSRRASGIIAQPQAAHVSEGPLAVASDSATRTMEESGSFPPAPGSEDFRAQHVVMETPVLTHRTQQLVLAAQSAPLAPVVAPDIEMSVTDTLDPHIDNPGSPSKSDNQAAGPSFDAAAVTPDSIPPLPADSAVTVSSWQDDQLLGEQAHWQSEGDGETDGLPLIAAALSGSALAPEEAPDASAAVNTIACRQFLGLTYIAAREVEADLAASGVRTSLKPLHKGPFLVYVEPLPSLQLARRKHSQLRRLGVPDLHIVRAGYYRHGISLGMLRNFELANRHKDSMSDLGVKTMRIGPVNVLSARYGLTIKGEPAIMDSVVMRHEVLADTNSESCHS